MFYFHTCSLLTIHKTRKHKRRKIRKKSTQNSFLLCNKKLISEKEKKSQVELSLKGKKKSERKKEATHLSKKRRRRKYYDFDIIFYSRSFRFLCMLCVFTLASVFRYIFLFIIFIMLFSFFPSLPSRIKSNTDLENVFIEGKSLVPYIKYGNGD